MLAGAQVCRMSGLVDYAGDLFGQWVRKFLATGDLMQVLDVGLGTHEREDEEACDASLAFSEIQVRFLDLCCPSVHFVCVSATVFPAEVLTPMPFPSCLAFSAVII